MRIALIGMEWDAADLVETQAGAELVGVFDPLPIAEVPYLGTDDDALKVFDDMPDIFGIITPDLPALRHSLFSRYPGDRLSSFISDCAHISDRATIGTGCLIQRGVTVMPKVRLGTCCKVNMGASLHHEVEVGDFSTIAPGARLLGRVHVGSGVYVGAGAIIRQGCKIGDGATIGAGAVVVTDIPAGVTVVGVPAKRLL